MHADITFLLIRISDECGVLSSIILEKMWTCEPYRDHPLHYLRDLICIHDPMEFFLSCSKEHVQQCITNFIFDHKLNNPEEFNNLVSSKCTVMSVKHQGGSKVQQVQL